MFYYICIYLFYICFDISVYLLEILFFLLRQCFPTIRSRDEVLTSIHVSNHLRATFEGWTPKQQEEIMNPEYTPDRLSSFLSLLLRQQERTGLGYASCMLRQASRNMFYPKPVLIPFVILSIYEHLSSPIQHNSSYNPKLFTIFLNSWQPAKDSSMTFRLSPLFSRPTQ